MRAEVASLGYPKQSNMESENQFNEQEIEDLERQLEEIRQATPRGIKLPTVAEMNTMLKNRVPWEEQPVFLRRPVNAVIANWIEKNNLSSEIASLDDETQEPNIHGNLVLNLVKLSRARRERAVKTRQKRKRVSKTSRIPKRGRK